MTRIASTIQLTGWANCVVTTISKAPVTRRIKRLSNIMISCHLLEELYTSHLLSTRNRLIEQNGKRKRLRKDLRACPCQGALIYHRCPQLFYWIFEFWRPHCSQQPLTLSLKTRLLKRNGLFSEKLPNILTRKPLKRRHKKSRWLFSSAAFSYFFNCCNAFSIVLPFPMCLALLESIAINSCVFMLSWIRYDIVIPPFFKK